MLSRQVAPVDLGYHTAILLRLVVGLEMERERQRNTLTIRKA